MGLTSRTLRHWESEGLFKSERDDSGWRVYDEDAVLRIGITALLRKIDIPISEIKLVAEEKSFESLRVAAEKKLSLIETQKVETISIENRLTKFLKFLRAQENNPITEESLKLLSDFNDEKESFNMSELKFVVLPKMRAAGNISVGISPEEDAMNPVFEWIDSAGLAGTARFFGGNMPPMPSGEGKPYGYGMCASIPKDVVIPEHLAEITVPGGVYAMLESTDDIPASWKKLMSLLSQNKKYKSDRSRQCYEEHIKNDRGDFLLYLYEPVK
jgi:DNA-binding transcriptional MerR regulator